MSVYIAHLLHYHYHPRAQRRVAVHQVRRVVVAAVLVVVARDPFNTGTKMSLITHMLLYLYVSIHHLVKNRKAVN
jgi:hypothetical protein